jgi:hypothetical protein
MATTKDLKTDPVNLGQALGVIANLVVTYIGALRPGVPVEGAASEEDGFKKYQQMAVAIVVHHIVSAAKHKKEMAHILHAIAADLEDPIPDEPSTDQKAGD